MPGRVFLRIAFRVRHGPEPVIEELLAILVMTGGAAITEFGEVSTWQP